MTNDTKTEIEGMKARVTKLEFAQAHKAGHAAAIREIVARLDGGDWGAAAAQVRAPHLAIVRPIPPRT